MKTWKQAAISLAVLAAAGVVWVRQFPDAAAVLERFGIATASVEHAPSGGSAGSASPASDRTAPVVTGAPVRAATVNDRVSAIGSGRALRSVTITPSVPGRVAAVDVASGDLVGAGAPLIRLDAEAEEIALDKARLTLDDARDTLVRVRELRSSNAVSEVQARAAELAVRQAELAVRDAALALDNRTVRAPFGGWIGILGIDVGDQVTTATEIASLDDRSQILVDFRLPERFVGKVAVGTPVSATPLSRPELALEGSVVTLDSRVDQETRTLRVRASIDNADDRLRAGMAFSIALAFPGDVFAAVDPLAVQWNTDGAYVWTGVDGRATQVPVRIVQRNNDAVLVDGDLPSGTMVVTQGVQMLRPGAPFRYEESVLPATAGERPGASPPPASVGSRPDRT